MGISTLFEWYVVRCSSKSKYQKDTFLKHWTMCSKNDNHSRLNDQHIWGDPYDCLMSSRILSLVMNKMFIRAPKISRKCLQHPSGWFTPSYIWHTRGFRTYLLGSYLRCINDYKVWHFSKLS